MYILGKNKVYLKDKKTGVCLKRSAFVSTHVFAECCVLWQNVNCHLQRKKIDVNT